MMEYVEVKTYKTLIAFNPATYPVVSATPRPDFSLI